MNESVTKGLDLNMLPLNDALLHIHVLGLAATIHQGCDTPARIGNPSFPFVLRDLPSSVDVAARRVEAALALVGDWPEAFHDLLARVAHRFPPSGDRRADKQAFASRVGKLLLYPPCDLSGRPLPPIYDEVFRFCRQDLGLRVAKRRQHTLDDVARSLYPCTNLSSLSRSLGVCSNDGLLGSVMRRVLEGLSPTEKELPRESLAPLVEERVHQLYHERLGSISGTEAARILEGDIHERQLSGWDHPLLLTPLAHLEGLGRPRQKAYAAEAVRKMRERISEIAVIRDSSAGMISVRTHAMRRCLGPGYAKTDLLLDLLGGQLPVSTTVAEPTIADLWTRPEDLTRCRVQAFIRHGASFDAYLSWSVIVRQLSPCYPEIKSITQWTLHYLANKGEITRQRSSAKAKWRYRLLDCLRLLDDYAGDVSISAM